MWQKKNPNWNLLPLCSVKSYLNFKAGNMSLFSVTAGIQNKIWFVLSINEYPNLDLIGNVRSDSVMYDFAPARTGHRGRLAKHGKTLSVETDFPMKKSVVIILVSVVSLLRSLAIRKFCLMSQLCELPLICTTKCINTP